jgi:hypothetical protein
LKNPLKGLEEVAEVEEISREVELMTEDPLVPTIVTNKATLQGIARI